MTDKFTPQKRSAIMARVRNRNTNPEIIVRKLLHRKGYRFRIHRKDLPGKPDIVLSKHRTVVFVHGCFWHGHPGCPRAARPKSNVDFWNRKLDKNMERDLEVYKELQSLGWRILVIWQCETRNLVALESLIDSFFNSTGEPFHGR